MAQDAYLTEEEMAPSSPAASAARESRASAGDTDDAADRAMARYADGDASAFQEVFERLAPRLQRFLRRLGSSNALADDLLQETFFKMHQARGNFSPGMPVAPWAYTIARNCYLDAVRSAKRRPQLLGDSQGISLSEPHAPPDADAEQRLIGRQAGEAVERALHKMTAMRREAFILLRYEGLSVAAAAEVLGASESAVKLRAFQAYKLIREELDRIGVERPADGVRSQPSGRTEKPGNESDVLT
jgi:RNA polymerase sigma-70 factor, ECF subfamily